MRYDESKEAAGMRYDQAKSIDKAKKTPRSFMPETKIQDLHKILMIYIYQK